MSAFHVVVHPRPSHARTPALASLHGLLDVVVEGVNITARIGEAQALPLLAELAYAVAALGAGRRDRATVQLVSEEETWELGLERDAEDVLFTVFRAGPCPELAVFERRVPLAELRRGLVEALEAPPAAQAVGSMRAALATARRSLAAEVQGPRTPRALVDVAVAPRPVEGFGFRLRAGLRAVPQPALPREGDDGCVERADLHGLLSLGEVKVLARGHEVGLGELPVFVVSEQLVMLAEEVLEAWQLARPLFRRIAFGGVKLGIRRGPGDGPLAFTVTSPQIRGERATKTFPEIAPPTFVQATVRLARALCEAIPRHDPRQRQNLRLAGLVKKSEQLDARLTAALAQDAVTNPEPESYRSFAPPPRPQAPGRWEHGGKMRFAARWVAAVPNIDLRGTFLCGDRLLVGAERETACIQAQSGHVVWRKPTQRANSVVTPAGLVRLHPDGRAVLHDLDSGHVRFTAQVEPRAGGGATGAVVHTPGLPKLLVLAEGSRRITAIDLGSGDIRWRYTSPRPASYRFRRAGKLLIVASGDAALIALDVVTGEVVWRVRGRLPFAGELVVDRESVFALSGVRGGASALTHLDPWTGNVLYTVELEDRHVAGQTPLVTAHTVIVPSRDRRGVGARAFDRLTGAELWHHEPGLSSPTTAWLAVDDSVVCNSAAGALLCLEAATGAVRFHHVFSRHVDADQPRRLEPILRSGALFVPQHQVYVVRPRDGEIIGEVPSDLIPDLVRVDEHCAVYVAEESGHLAAFHAAPKLALVR